MSRAAVLLGLWRELSWGRVRVTRTGDGQPGGVERPVLDARLPFAARGLERLRAHASARPGQRRCPGRRVRLSTKRAPPRCKRGDRPPAAVPHAGDSGRRACLPQALRASNHTCPVRLRRWMQRTRRRSLAPGARLARGAGASC